MTVPVEHIILSGILKNDEYTRQTLPYIKSEYFQTKPDKLVFETISDYINEYGSAPNKTALLVEVSENSKYDTATTEEATLTVKELYSLDQDHDIKWLVKQTEEFCQNKAIYNAIMTSISIYDGSNKDLTPHAIPDIVKDAVGISFDNHVGMDFEDDAKSRWEYYTEPDHKIPFDIETLNEITNGGVGKKTLNMIVAGVNAGKTLSLIHLTSAYARAGLNVLYITLEMREEEILKRIDANMLNVDMNGLASYSCDDYMNKIDKLKQKNYGKIKVKEFPPGAANASHFKHLIHELKMKQRFTPEVVIIDYIGIAGSSRVKYGQQNSYFFLKAVAEEFRAIAVEFDLVVWSAMQLNRQGISNSDVEITDVSDSMGIPQTADSMFSLTRSEELDELGQVLFKQLKNRYGNKSTKTRFTVGVNLETQRLYEVNQSEQVERAPEVQQVFANSNKSLKDKFNSFKV